MIGSGEEYNRFLKNPIWVEKMAYVMKSLALGSLLLSGVVIAFRFNVDFAVLYRVAKEIGLSTLQVYEPTVGEPGFFYGPVSLVLIRPLALLSYAEGHLLWIALQSVIFVLFWWLLRRQFSFLGSASLWAWLVVWGASINGIHNSFQSGNIQLMLAVILLAAEDLAKGSKRRQVWGGILLACAAAVKVYPAFMIVFYFLLGSRRMIGGIFIGLLACVLFPTLFFGGLDSWNLHVAFFRNLFIYHQGNSFGAIPDILCLPSLIHRITDGWVNAAVVTPLTVGILSAVSLAYYLTVYKNRLQLGLRKPLWSLGLALMILVNPSTRVHYFVLLVPAVASLVELWIEGHRSKIATYVTAIALVLVCLTTEEIVGKTLNNFLEYRGFPTWGILMLCLVLAVTCIRSSRRLERSAI